MHYYKSVRWIDYILFRVPLEKSSLSFRDVMIGGERLRCYLCYLLGHCWAVTAYGQGEVLARTRDLSVQCLAKRTSQMAQLFGQHLRQAREPILAGMSTSTVEEQMKKKRQRQIDNTLWQRSKFRRQFKKDSNSLSLADVNN